MTTPAQLIAWIEGNVLIHQGALAGQPFRLLTWQRKFLRGAFGREVTDSALTIGRGNGKSSLIAAIVTAGLDGPLRQPNSEIIVAASSFEQGRIIGRTVLAYLGDKVEDKSTWRVQDSANRFVVTHRPSGASLRCVGSDPAKAHGLQPAMVIADEVAQWDHTKIEAMLSALRTSLGKIEGSRMISIGTRAASPDHPFEQMLKDPDTFSLTYAARGDDPPFRKATWLRANPSLKMMPNLEKRIRLEARNARRDPAQLASFKSLRLNLGTSDVVEMELIAPEVWRGAEGDAEAVGDLSWGIDLGGAKALSAVACYWPQTGRLEVIGAFPEYPDLRLRGLADGVGSRYQIMEERGELLVLGARIPDVSRLLGEALSRWGRPSIISCDRWRAEELKQVLGIINFPLANLSTRGAGWRDGAQDVRRFQSAVLEGRVVPVESLMLRSAIAEARLLGDPAGNFKLAVGSAGGRRSSARDDAAAAAILAVAASERSYRGPRDIRGAAQGHVRAV